MWVEGWGGVGCGHYPSHDTTRAPLHLPNHPSYTSPTTHHTHHTTPHPHPHARTQTQRTVVSRELCSVLSKGTRTICYLDEAALLEGASGGTGALLMGIKEEEVRPPPPEQADGEGEGGEARVFYGVCMVDPTTGTFHLGQFEDGAQRWRLRTLLSQFSPSEVGSTCRQGCGLVRFRFGVMVYLEGTERLHHLSSPPSLPTSNTPTQTNNQPTT